MMKSRSKYRCSYSQSNTLSCDTIQWLNSLHGMYHETLEDGVGTLDGADLVFIMWEMQSENLSLSTHVCKHLSMPGVWTPVSYCVVQLAYDIADLADFSIHPQREEAGCFFFQYIEGILRMLEIAEVACVSVPVTANDSICVLEGEGWICVGEMDDLYNFELDLSVNDS